MAKEDHFWLGVIVGWVLMVVLSPLLPVLGPLVAGFVAGLLARQGLWNGGKAGFLAGVLGALIAGVLLIIGGTFFLGILGFIASLGVAAVLLTAFLYFGVLGFVGGAVGGFLAK